jgi:hypothetical protein
VAAIRNLNLSAGVAFAVGAVDALAGDAFTDAFEAAWGGGIADALARG